MAGPIVYLNGAFVPAEAASVSVFDRGFLYGDSVFETVRAYGGKAFAVGEHYERLAGSASRIGMALPFERTGFARILAELLAENGLDNAMLRFTVSRGVGPAPVPDPAGCESPTVVVLPRPVPPWDREAWRAGIATVISPVPATPPEVLDPAAKTGNFLSHIMAIAHARSHGAREAILLDAKGNVAEGAASNLFGVWNGALTTPPADGAILPGVTRALVLQVAREEGITCREEAISPYLLGRADELFVTNTGWEVMPVAAVNGRPIGDGRAGPVAERLLAAYRRLVARRLGVTAPGDA
ncbi:MAG: aminotransferase class IV [Nitrospirae bacterium]|nr:aminotransferase class IV [Nitrospirota bacterium]